MGVSYLHVLTTKKWTLLICHELADDSGLLHVAKSEEYQY